MAEDILVQLRDLHKQATEERSHNYVGACVKAAIAEIELLRAHPLLSVISPTKGCVCPGDAPLYCQNQLCPRKAIPNLVRA